MVNKDLSCKYSFDREIRLLCLSTDISNLPTAWQILTNSLYAWSPAPPEPTFPQFGFGGFWAAWFIAWVLSPGQSEGKGSGDHPLQPVLFQESGNQGAEGKLSAVGCLWGLPRLTSPLLLKVWCFFFLSKVKFLLTASDFQITHINP